jgi:hypothetical protein
LYIISINEKTALATEPFFKYDGHIEVLRRKAAGGVADQPERNFPRFASCDAGEKNG